MLVSAPERKVAPNIYKRGKVYYYRQGGKRVNLQTGDLTTARALVKEIKAQKVLADVGAGPGIQSTGFRRVSDVLNFYLESDCPKRNESPRTGRQLIEEQRRIRNIDALIGKRSPHAFTVSDCRDYARERLAQFEGNKGARAVDIELAALSCAFRWSAKHPRHSGILQNPVEHYRPRYAKAESVAHCREFQPASANELHALARWMFGRARSQILGWQCLFAAMIGQRCSELLQLRIDGTGPHCPGWIHEGNLFLYRSQTHKGTASFLSIHPALDEAIKVHREWLKAYFPDSPWWFPSPNNLGSPVERNALVRRLRDACKDLGLPQRTAHGLRSYFVNVLRSQGWPDYKIALQIGHKTGGQLIVETYGEILPVRLDWMPEGKPAWSCV
jgi:integrase